MPKQNSKPSTKDANLKLYRIHQIDEAIRSGSFPNRVTLSKKLEVSERTIARDLEYLRDFYDAPIEFDTTHNGFYYSKKDFFVKYVTLSEGELFSISLFDQLLVQYKNTPLEKQLRSIFKKITSSLPENVQVDSRFLLNEVTYVSEPLPKIDTKIFDIVMNSLKTRNSINIEYKSLTQGKTAARKIDPYHVVCKGGAWYVIAFCHLKNEMRIFSLSRIESAEKTRERFSVPKDFKVENYIDPSFGVWASEKKKRTIKFRCTGYLAQIATEQKWHENQTTKVLPSGDVEVSFQTTQLTEAFHLVMSLGENATVLEPKELVAMVTKSIAGMAKNYGGKKFKKIENFLLPVTLFVTPSVVK